MCKRFSARAAKRAERREAKKAITRTLAQIEQERQAELARLQREELALREAELEAWLKKYEREPSSPAPETVVDNGYYDDEGEFEPFNLRSFPQRRKAQQAEEDKVLLPDPT